jgi:hypothetical protein
MIVYQSHNYNPGLAQKIDSMYVADSLNEAKAKEIVSKYGYPGFDIVGEKGSGRFWAIVQHCDNDIQFQEKIILLMKKEIVTNNASRENFAYLEDRVLVNKNQKQIFGTQCHLNSKTHQWEPFPLKDPSKVDILRKSMGIEPLADYLKSMNKK